MVFGIRDANVHVMWRRIHEDLVFDGDFGVVVACGQGGRKLGELFPGIQLDGEVVFLCPESVGER